MRKTQKLCPLNKQYGRFLYIPRKIVTLKMCVKEQENKNKTQPLNKQYGRFLIYFKKVQLS